MNLTQTVTSESRAAIEAVLKGANRPLSAQEVSDLSGVSISITRTHLGNAIQHGRAHNLHPGRRGAALYVWGSGKQETVLPLARFVPIGHYTGEKAIVTRPGSGDAFNLPSRRGASLVPHALPLSMAGGDPA